MNLALSVSQFHCNCLQFADPIRNNVLNDSKFVRINYITESFGTNGVHLLFPLNEQTCRNVGTGTGTGTGTGSSSSTTEGGDHSEYKLSPMLCDALICIEQDILAKYTFSPACQQKLPQHKLSELLRSANIKLLDNVDFSNQTTHASVALKLSGLWETQTHFGLTFKFVPTTELLPTYNTASGSMHAPQNPSV